GAPSPRITLWHPSDGFGASTRWRCSPPSRGEEYRLLGPAGVAGPQVQLALRPAIPGEVVGPLGPVLRIDGLPVEVAQLLRLLQRRAEAVRHVPERLDPVALRLRLHRRSPEVVRLVRDDLERE